MFVSYDLKYVREFASKTLKHTATQSQIKPKDFCSHLTNTKNTISDPFKPKITNKTSSTKFL